MKKNEEYRLQVMMNNGRAPHKMSDIEKLTNRFIVFCVIMLILMVIIQAILSGVTLAKHWTDGHPDAPYIPENIQSPPVWGVLAIGFFIICYQVAVPVFFSYFWCQRVLQRVYVNSKEAFAARPLELKESFISGPGADFPLHHRWADKIRTDLFHPTGSRALWRRKRKPAPFLLYIFVYLGFWYKLSLSQHSGRTRPDYSCPQRQDGYPNGE